MWSAAQHEKRLGQRAAAKQRRPKKRAAVAADDAGGKRAAKRAREPEFRERQDASSREERRAGTEGGAADFAARRDADTENGGGGDEELSIDAVQAELDKAQREKWMLFEQYSLAVEKICAEFQQIVRLKLQLEDESDERLVNGLNDAKCLYQGLSEAYGVIETRMRRPAFNPADSD